MDPYGNRAVRRFNMSLGRLSFIILIIMLGTASLTYLLLPKGPPPPSTSYFQLQRLHQETQGKLAEAEGVLALKNEQISGLKTELQKKERQTEDLKQRINAYESILEARKSSGVHILRARAIWKSPKLLDYDIVLVKGGNYPRRVSGSLRITARSQDGHELMLELGKDAPELPYLVETHIFLHGSYEWNQDWRPDHLSIIRLNHKGENRDQMEIEIQGGAT